MNRIDRQQYADLLEDDSLNHLINGLDQLYQATAPEDLRASIGMLATQEQPERQGARHRAASLWPFGRARRRLPLLGVAALAALLVTGVVAADSGPVEWAMSLFTGTGQPGTPVQGESINLSQTICGYTITVNRVYADASRAVIGYAITGPTGRTVNSLSASPSLSNDQGHTFAPAGGAGSALQNTVSGAASVFDLSPVQNLGGQLNLHLTFPSIQAVEPATSTLPAAACEQPTSSGQDLAGDQSSVSPVRMFTIAGPFNFNLVAPVTPGLTLQQVNQTLTSTHGTTVTLEKVVVTPSNVRIYVKGPDIADLASGPAIVSTLYVDGQEVMALSETSIDGAEQVETITADLFNKQGDWQVKVLTDPTLQNNNRQYTDSVTFHVTMP